MVKVIVQYVVSANGFNRRYWLRAEGSPNSRAYATRFDNSTDAENEADIVRENVRGIIGNIPRFTFISVNE